MMDDFSKHKRRNTSLIERPRQLQAPSTFGARSRRRSGRPPQIEWLERRELLSIVSGMVWDDSNGNGVHETAEPGLDGWQVQLIDTQGRVVATVVTRSENRDADPAIDPATESGLYDFAGVAPGNYVVNQVRPDGWLQTLPLKNALSAARDIVLAPPAHPPLDPKNTPTWLPDLTVDTTTPKTGINDWYVDGHELRFGLGTPNIGLGLLEMRAGPEQGDGTQIVNQRVYDNRGGFTDRVAGVFQFHPEHHHTHFNEYAEYNLRALMPDADGDGVPEVGDVIAVGAKTSFCLENVLPFDTTLPNATSRAPRYGCEGYQRVDVGWQDVYTARTPGQSIDITNVAVGEYWLEAIVDPANSVLESDETNNVARRLVTIPSDAALYGRTVQVVLGFDSTTNDFGNFRQITIRGQEFADRNGNGTRDAGESPLEGWRVYIDTNNNGELDNWVDGNGVCDGFADEPCTVTDVNGNYSIPILGPGGYVVRQVRKFGYARSLPVDAAYVFDAESGIDAANLDFGNDNAGPIVVSGQTIVGPTGITNIVVIFNERLDGSQAVRLKNYRLTGPGHDGPQRLDATGRKIRLRAATYDPNTHSVRLTPAKPLAWDQVFHLSIDGSSGLADRFGNRLDGDADGRSEGDFKAAFGRGTSLTYVDSEGDLVTLQLSGNGAMELMWSNFNDDPRLELLDTISDVSVLTGSVTRQSSGDGSTALELTAAPGTFVNNLPTTIHLSSSGGSAIAAVFDELLDSGFSAAKRRPSDLLDDDNPGREP